MYISSDGTKKDVSTLNTEYVINALAKCSREIFNSESMQDYEKYINNITILKQELDNRIDLFVQKNISMWEE